MGECNKPEGPKKRIRTFAFILLTGMGHLGDSGGRNRIILKTILHKFEVKTCYQMD